MGEYHNGYSFSGTIRNRLPRELWCSVESNTPKIISGTEIRWIHSIGLCQPNFSHTTGMNSRKSTVLYRVTHQATSNITECGFHITRGCHRRSGRPRSYSSPTTTSEYPRNAVKIDRKSVA